MDIALWRNKDKDGQEWIYADENFKEEKVVTTPVEQDYLEEAVPGDICNGMSRSKCLETKMKDGISKVLSETAVSVELDRSASTMKLYCRNAKEAESNKDWSVCYDRPDVSQQDKSFAYGAAVAAGCLGVFAVVLCICKSQKKFCFAGHHDDDDDHDHGTELSTRRDPVVETLPGTNIPKDKPKKSMTTTFSPGHWRLKEAAPRIHDTSFDATRLGERDVGRAKTGESVGGEVDDTA